MGSDVSSNESSPTGAPDIDDEGNIRVAQFELPISSYMDASTHDLLVGWTKWESKILRLLPGHWTDPKVTPAYREILNKHFYPKVIERTKELYDVRIHQELIGGVRTEVFLPTADISAEHQHRVLINLHGGGFIVGARYGGQLESIPVAAIGRIKVVSVDYRMAPEFKFPAATEDVLSVYSQLLKSYEPSAIGIFGCSAGAVLAAQTIARLQRDGLPLPGAIGMFFAGADYWAGGDSAIFGAARTGIPLKPLNAHPYFVDVDPRDPLVAPIYSNDVMAGFPRSLLVAATRDHVLSSVVHTHSRLVSLGVPADLHVWEGLDHAFFSNPDLPQSREVHELTAKFFARHLSRPVIAVAARNRSGS